MANENSKTQPQLIPLSKIHDLPGVFIPKPQDKALGSMVLSVQNSGVKEAVVLRQRDDGEYQLLSGYRRRRASELAQKQDIPALVYEMTLQEAIAYTKAVREKPDTPVPGKLLDPSAEKAKTAEAAPPVAGKDDKGNQGKAPAEAADKGKDDKANAAPSDKSTQGEAPPTPEDKTKPDKSPTAPEGKAKGGEAPAAPEDKAKPDKAAAPEDKAKKDGAPTVPEDKAKDGNAPATPDDKAKGGEAPATPTVAELEARVKAGEKISLTELAAAGKAEREGKTQTAASDKNKPGKSADADKSKDTGAVLTAASEGPAGTSITQIFDKRLDPPDEAARKSLPTPKEGESYFITLHPAYLEKSVFNNFSVDIESENFKELMKSVELVGIKDPVLARFTTEGKLEILSGQRRHIAAIMLNQAVPTIIQKIDDADAKIIVADGNLHRDKISSYDLSRALRMKMEGIVFNSVSFVDGKKYRSDFKSYFGDLRNMSNEVSRERGLSVIEPEGKGKHYTEWQAEKHGRNTVRDLIRQDIDAAIAEGFTFDSFLAALRKQGYTIKYGANVKHTAVRPPDGELFFRLDSLGEGYTEADIRNRLTAARNGEQHEAPAPPIPPLPILRTYKRYTLRKGVIRHRKLRGFRALYTRYLYFLSERSTPQRSKTSFAVRREVTKLQRYSRQFRFLLQYRIDTDKQLTMLGEALQGQIDLLVDYRKELYIQRRTGRDVDAELEDIGQKLRSTRRELKLCRQIAEDIPRITENIQEKEVIKPEEKLRKETKGKWM